jgi:hypothetical protein
VAQLPQPNRDKPGARDVLKLGVRIVAVYLAQAVKEQNGRNLRRREGKRRGPIASSPPRFSERLSVLSFNLQAYETQQKNQSID